MRQSASKRLSDIDAVTIKEKNLPLLQTLGTVLVECRPTASSRFHFLDTGAGLKGRRALFHR
ncbi:hypothetical protein PUN4_270013 [Paraburkholderia unamae]|nr:hypothetical protein PUN4_270013 [Paraburkholderia unamae]